MKNLIPSVAHLKAFEAAGRHLSFTEAAKELNLTQAAVSYRIKVLEDQLGIQLFRRSNRRIALTEAGKSYLPPVTECLQRLQGATLRLTGEENHGPRTLRVLAMQAFATLWLVPRLNRFRNFNKDAQDVEIQVMSWVGGLDHMDEGDFYRHGIDVTIIYTDDRENLPGLESEILETDIAIPVCSPALMAGPPPIKSLQDLKHHTVVDALTWPKMWSRWLNEAGAADVEPASHLRLQNSLLAVQAALSGVGVAMGHKLLVSEHLRSGNLVAPFDLELPIEHGYYFACRRDNCGFPSIVAFKNWLRAELELARGL